MEKAGPVPGPPLLDGPEWAQDHHSQAHHFNCGLSAPWPWSSALCRVRKGFGGKRPLGGSLQFLKLPQLEEEQEVPWPAIATEGREKLSGICSSWPQRGRGRKKRKPQECPFTLVCVSWSRSCSHSQG